MNLIYSADENWGIGKAGDLLFRAKGDLANFRRMTTGATVVMGRKTLESLPDGRALPDRENIVLTRDEGFSAPEVTACRSLEELFQLLRDHDDENIFIIGGAEIYNLLEPYCVRALITRWQTSFDADTFGPDLDASDAWAMIDEAPSREEGGVGYTFRRYLQRAPKPWK